MGYFVHPTMVLKAVVHFHAVPICTVTVPKSTIYNYNLQLQFTTTIYNYNLQLQFTTI